MKKISASLIIREVQIKTKMRCHLTLVRMAIIKKSTNNKQMAKLLNKGNFYTVVENGKQYGGSSKN